MWIAPSGLLPASKGCGEDIPKRTQKTGEEREYAEGNEMATKCRKRARGRAARSERIMQRRADRPANAFTGRRILKVAWAADLRLVAEAAVLSDERNAEHDGAHRLVRRLALAPRNVGDD